MQRGTTTMDRELPVKLSEHEIAERGETIATKMLRVKALRKKRREDFRNMSAQIDAELDNIETLAETIVNGMENRKQAELFVDQVRDAEAQETLAAVAEGIEIEGNGEAKADSEKRFHRDGALCRKDPCKRRHLTAEQLRANEIVPEGEEIGSVTQADGEAKRPEVGSPCPGCDQPIASAMEAVKGLCESCQLSKGGDPLEGTPQAAPADTEGGGGEGAQQEGEPVALDMRGDETTATPIEDGAGINGDEAEEDDPRARCSGCSAVLNADEVMSKLGLCAACVAAAGGEDEHAAHDGLVGGEA